jgi:hypothetical protein
METGSKQEYDAFWCAMKGAIGALKPYTSQPCQVSPEDGYSMLLQNFGIDL